MTSQFESNVNFINKNRNHLIRDINQDALLYQFVGMEKEEEFFITKDGRVYILKQEGDHSNFPNPLKRELFFIVGINSVEEIKNIIKCANPKAFFVIIEPEPSFFYHALQTKSLDFLANDNVMLIVEEIENLSGILENTFRTTPMLNLVKNIHFYATYFYRHFASEIYLKLVKEISSTIKTFLFNIGNSIEDSLQGFTQNMSNIKYMEHSKDITKLKNAFREVPAIIVSAGPSLDKNIRQLKKAQGKAVIIAVDTILQKLVDEGIIPDFVCTVERDKVVYDYFYKNKDIPSNTTLVVPPLVYSDIIEEYPGDYILPLRLNVFEYIWFGELWNLTNDYFIPMGSSCAHLAFGLAEHLGASPIILTGQDLAYAEDNGKSHSSGTIYDKGDLSDIYKQEIFEVEGYYGKPVRTYHIWDAFRKWFEIEISVRGANVINATEGGAKISNTLQMPLVDAINTYCIQEINFRKVMDECPLVPFDNEDIRKKLENEVNSVKQLIRKTDSMKENLIKIDKLINEKMDSKQLLALLNKMKETDELLPMISNHKLLYHILLPELTVQIRELCAIDEILSYTNIKRNLEIQIRLVTVTNFVLKKMNEIIMDNLNPQ